MKAMKSDRARQLVSVNWDTMTAQACDGVRYKLSVVSSTPTPGAVGKAADMLLAAAQGVVNDALEEAEDRVHICDRNDDDRKARAMPPMLQALYHAVKAVQRAAPSRPSEAKAGECRHCLGRGHCFQCFGAKAGEDA